MSAAKVFLSLPALDLFKIPPSNDPITIQPPAPGPTSSSLIYISSEIYNAALDPRVPTTIACVYAAIVTALNAYNKGNGYKAWFISKTNTFFTFVVLHNIFLAVYSGWTFIGMLRALLNIFANPLGTSGVVETVDSLCKIHGPSGLGNAVTYNPSLSIWSSTSAKVHLSDMQTPDPTDLGRFWNEGLAFYGWFFYLSKFYEVLDTLIILAKGKRSSTLQTYHHAGAMLCMWAGIRFMSPPIWMFVFVNSFIHTLMYTYYTLTAFSVPVPLALKRSLTTLQIVQFLVGSAYAAVHSFVSYTIPVSVPVTEMVKTVVPAATAASSSLAALATAAGLGGLLKKVLGEDTLRAEKSEFTTVTRWETVMTDVPCIDTSGQTIAIWLNVLYLAPLTALFVRFFIKSYFKHAKST